MIVESLDRLAAGRNATYRIAEDLRTHPRTERAFTAITWLLAVEFVLGVAALAIALVLTLNGQQVPWPVWFRGLVVLGITTTLFYFAWRARSGFYWAYSRLRLFSKIFPLVTLVIAAIPGLYPLWMITEQILFSLVLFGIGEYLSSDHMRSAFSKPDRGNTR
ncbi:hypothetical protein [Subtercola boreus]|uniref:Uncharacterized protein n=1 Tax=Subtercola boreus TaxID=120213 RepID=A0A3E0WCS7_9MICO|nr:hypothetical protein [Subtercola boreus]RFA20351.1 hypothetical protein B7R24_10160 [Subtercola boreus]RFA20505.1 hypothetical protein B7R23_10100 [Subtercola boreus]RFA26754.1 hypothetical protein B7R25_10225 [Subtercola boreus]